MPGSDDRTKTASQGSSDPALDPTVQADPSAPQPSNGDGAVVDDVPRVASIGRYRVIDVLGSGGMGVVYRARDPELDRELAIKVVRAHSGTTRAQERLLEEARAMAKLRHPAVVPVFDVGTTERGVFIVMPMVEGGTMHDWMKRERPWREVAERFLTAGRGLAAAHAAGFVHRDFKPRNVLISDRGEVMVADFGIAARTDDSIDPERLSSTPGSAQVSSIAGTPAYMAPEQAESGTIDARADQYSFCVSFWEALCGERPPEAKRRSAPAWLLAAVERGFSASPDRRWPSMTALLEHIERRMRRPRRIAAAAAAFALVAAGAAVAWKLTSQDAATPCTGGPERLAGIWDDDVRARVRAGLVATRAPFAEEAWKTVSSALDDWRRDWLAMYGDSCRATRVRGDQSEQALDLRTACLDRHRDDVRALTAALTTADAAAVEAAPQAARRLASVAECADLERLGRDVRLPADPAQRARVEAIRARLRDVSTALELGAIARAEATAPPVLTDARAADFPLLHAEADLVEGLLAEARADYKRATTRFEAAVWSAEAVGDDRLKLTALFEVAEVSWLTGDFAAGERWLAAAEATLERRGSPHDERLTLLATRANLLGKQGKHDEARDLVDQALRESRSAPGHNDVLIAKVLAGTAMRRLQLGEHDEGRARVRDAIAIFERELGPNHPVIGKLLVWTGASFYQQGNHVEAQAPLDRALALLEGAYGPDHPEVARALVNLGLVAMGKGDHATSIALLERAMTIQERSFGPESSDVARTLGNLANAYDESGNGARAIELGRRGLSILEKTVGADHPQALIASVNLAQSLRVAKRAAEAVPLLERAVEKLPGKIDPVFLSNAQVELGICYLDLGQATRAITPLEAAVAHVTDAEVDPDLRGAASLALARALWETGRDRKRALALARDAEAAYAIALGPSGVEGLGEVRAWRATHDPK